MAALDSLKIPEEKKKYITEQLNPLLTELVTDCLKQCPAEPAAFMLEWLRKKKGIQLDSGDVEKLTEENEKLKDEIKTLSKTLNDCSGVLATLTKNDDAKEAEEESEEEDDDDEGPDELPEFAQKAVKKGPRQSVSAEAYGAWNKKKEFTPKVIVKSQEQKTRLKDVLSKSFLFAALEEKDFGVVIDAMEEQIFEAGKEIIRMGDDGDYLFVIEEGKLECYKDIEGVSTVVKTCEAGDVFGELALLYNTTRAANVRSTTKCTLWQLDRETFNAIVKDAAASKRSRYESFLKQVTLLKNMTSYELSQIADALKAEVYENGEHIVTEGEAGDKFYIVESGNPVAVKGGEVVMQYQQADYFGELALLMEQPRLATVKAGEERCKVLSLDRKSFKRLLGPLDEIMRRAVSEKYSPSK
ncbi:unnamed protein product [Amoebophrya sp. A120]|nr:unnamed protein product [Amoebophrya sp. A120]|eukprot:GSA120T00005709001.1